MLKSDAKKSQGKFWPQVRAMIWEKAKQLYQQDEARGTSNDFAGITLQKRNLEKADTSTKPSSSFYETYGRGRNA